MFELEEKQIHRFNISTPSVNGLDMNSGTRSVNVRPNEYGIELYDIITKTENYENWNAITVGNVSNVIWNFAQEKGSVKADIPMTFNTTQPTPRTYAIETSVPRRLWGNGGTDYYNEFRDGISRALQNKTRLLMLSQICWGGNAGIADNFGIDPIFGSSKTLGDYNLVTVADAEQGLGDLVAAYMTGTGSYPKHMVINETMAAHLVANDNVSIGSMVVGLDRIYDTQVFVIPNFSTTFYGGVANAPAAIVGDFSYYWLYTPMSDGRHEINLEGHDNLKTESTVYYHDLQKNETVVEYAEIVAGTVKQNLKFMSGMFTITSGVSNPFILNLSSLDGQSVLG